MVIGGNLPQVANLREVVSLGDNFVTRREAILAVLNREPVERPPVSVRMELWHADAVLNGALPQEIKGLSREEVEDYLGFCRAARTGLDRG